MKKIIRDILILILIGIFLACIVWWILGLQFAIMTLGVYGLLFKILSMISDNKKKDK